MKISEYSKKTGIDEKTIRKCLMEHFQNEGYGPDGIEYGPIEYLDKFCNKPYREPEDPTPRWKGDDSPV